MSTAQHTPGPWGAWIKHSPYSMTGPSAAASMTAINALREAGYGRETDYGKLFVEMSSKGMKCPALALGDTREEAEANARIIEAAPDLLAALRLFVGENRTHTERERLDAAVAAIAKATGSAA